MSYRLQDWDLLAAPDPRPKHNSDRHIALLAKDEDFQCVLMASMGLGDLAIQDATGLSLGQIHYRLRKAKAVMGHAHITRKEFRRGRSPFARELANQASAFIEKRLTQTLRELPDEVAYGKHDIIIEPKARAA